MIDRRTFLTVGASTLAGIMLPRVPGCENTFMLPFASSQAFADEENPFKVLVLSRSMFAVVVVDVSGGNRPIENAQVTLTSRYASGKTLTGATDAEGTVIFEVGPLSEGYIDENTPLDAYDFNGGISVSMQGYRDVEIPLARIVGGTAISAPTRPLADGQPYFRQLTFDEWDIQYATSTFMMLPDDGGANEQPDVHAIAAQAYLPQGGQATLHVNKVMPAAAGQPKVTTSIGEVSASAQGEGNLATFTLEKAFLDKASGLLEEGCSLGLALDYLGKTYRLTSAMGVATAPNSKAESGSTSIVPSTVDQEVTPFDFPSPFPHIGGSKFTFWMPEFPVLFNFSFAGYVLFGVGVKPVSYKNDEGNIDPDYWKKSPRESGQAQAKTYIKGMKGKWDQYKNMTASGTDPKRSKYLQHHCTPLFLFDIALQGYGSLAYDWIGKTWGGNDDPAMGSLQGLFQVKTDLVWTEQITLGPVPFIIVINPWVLTKIAMGIGCKTHGSGADFFKNLDFDFSKTAVSFTIQVGLALTLGVGIAGVMSAGMRGAASITLFIGYEKAEGKQLPRLRVGANADVDVVLQFLMFKWTGKVWSYSNPTIADSWNMSVDNAEHRTNRLSELTLGGKNPYTLKPRFGQDGGADVRIRRWVPCCSTSTFPMRIASVRRSR